MLVLTSLGLSQAKIAGALDIDVQTVKEHTSELCQKFGVGAGWQAVAAAYRHEVLR